MKIKCIIAAATLTVSTFAFAANEKPANLTEIMNKFTSLTEIQRDAWLRNNSKKTSTDGICKVEEVNKTSWLSEIREAAFEIRCEIVGSNSAILFLGSDREEVVSQLERGESVRFSGKIHTIKDWGFWRTAYIFVE